MLSEGRAYARTSESRLSPPSLGQTRTHVLVGQEEDARRFRQSRAALCRSELLDSISLRKLRSHSAARLAINASHGPRPDGTSSLAQARHERPCASPTVRGGRHSRATYHFRFSRSKQTIQNVGLPSPVPSQWQADRVQITQVIWVGRVRSGLLWMAW